MRGGRNLGHAARCTGSNTDADGCASSSPVVVGAIDRSRPDHSPPRGRGRAWRRTRFDRRFAKRSMACVTSNDLLESLPPVVLRHGSSRALGDSIRQTPCGRSGSDPGARRCRYRRRHRLRPSYADLWDSCADISDEIVRTLVDRPPIAIGDEPSVREGIDKSLDEWRALRDGGKDESPAYRRRSERVPGISSLRSVTTRSSVTSSGNQQQLPHLVPADYQRRQTLAGAEALRNARSRTTKREFLPPPSAWKSASASCSRAFAHESVQRSGGCRRFLQIIAELDVLASFAEAAAKEGYTRPELTDDFSLEISAGRHPVVERMMPREKFIPNDVP